MDVRRRSCSLPDIVQCATPFPVGHPAEETTTVKNRYRYDIFLANQPATHSINNYSPRIYLVVVALQQMRCWWWCQEHSTESWDMIGRNSIAKALSRRLSRRPTTCWVHLVGSDSALETVVSITIYYVQTNELGRQMRFGQRESSSWWLLFIETECTYLIAHV